MNNQPRRSRSLLPKTKFYRRLGCLLLLLLVVAAPLTIYYIGHQESLRQLANDGINLFPHNPSGQTLTLPPQSSTSTPNIPPNIGNTCGARRNPDGTYAFSWLHFVNGFMFDEHNCRVHLLGLNMGGLSLGDAGHETPQVIAWYKQHIPMNVVRESINTYWWNSDVYVPDQRMHFRQWLQTVVRWQEAQGNYVILDDTTQFHNPPCGNDGMGYHVSLCPSQNQANKNNPPDPTEKLTYQPTALAAFTDLARLYSNDPAIIFDVWNEPNNQQLQGISNKTFLQYMNDRIDTVRRYDPRSIVMVYDYILPNIEVGKLPNYNQSNLLWDTHLYSPGWNPGDGASNNVTFAHNHNQAYIIGEWGGSSGLPSPATIMPFIKPNDVASTYFLADNLINGTHENPVGLNSIGQAVANGYASIFENP